jgi:hypothetical protein
VNTSVRHARKCKAASPVGNGFIFALEFPRLSAREVGNGARQAQIHTRESEKGFVLRVNAETPSAAGFISGLASPRPFARAGELADRCAG